MNIRSTKQFFESNGVVALKADKNESPEVNALLKELGNTATAIPYYAIYAPGLDEPIHFGGNILTASQVKSEVQKALDAAAAFTGGSQPGKVAASANSDGQF